MVKKMKLFGASVCGSIKMYGSFGVKLEAWCLGSFNSCGCRFRVEGG